MAKKINVSEEGRKIRSETGRKNLLAWKAKNPDGGKATHGSMHHRAPGSIGMAAYPAKVLRGSRGPGQDGNRRVTVKNLKVVRIDAERNLLLVRGAVPGSKGMTLMIRKSLSNKPAQEA